MMYNVVHYYTVWSGGLHVKTFLYSTSDVTELRETRVNVVLIETQILINTSCIGIGIINVLQKSFVSYAHYAHFMYTYNYNVGIRKK